MSMGVGEGVSTPTRTASSKMSLWENVPPKEQFCNIEDVEIMVILEGHVPRKTMIIIKDCNHLLDCLLFWVQSI